MKLWYNRWTSKRVSVVIENFGLSYAIVFKFLVLLILFKSKFVKYSSNITKFPLVAKNEQTNQEPILSLNEQTRSEIEGRMPYLYVDVNITDTEMSTIEVFEGDKAETLGKNWMNYITIKLTMI